MNSDFDYLKLLETKGGPDVSEYERVDAAFKSIMSAKRLGLITGEQIRDAWKMLGEAFGPDTMQGHGIRKPFGYAGDFEMIDRIYRQSKTENERTQRWDEYFQSRDACEAVRNRKIYFHNLLSSEWQGNGQNFNVLNVGSGPARDVVEFLDSAGQNCNIAIDCVDMDRNAICYARELCKGTNGKVAFFEANIFRWKCESSYDLIWSAGLFDYLDDNAFVFLIRHLSSMLKSTGRLVVGNFSHNNPTRDYMEFGEWFLNYRSKRDLEVLFNTCGIVGFSSWVEEEPREINLFLNIRRESAYA